MAVVGRHDMMGNIHMTLRFVNIYASDCVAVRAYIMYAYIKRCYGTCKANGLTVGARLTMRQCTFVSS